jgi:uncharacterized repeat protein (TIGR04076 family)
LATANNTGNGDMEYVEKIQLFVDGGSRGNPGPAACAYVIKNADGEILKVEGIYLGDATNNVAEYKALLNGLDALSQMNIHELAILSDSELMVKQLIGEYHVRDKNLMELFEQVQRKLLGFDRWHIKHIRRELNRDADQVVNETLDRQTGPQKQETDQMAGTATEPSTCTSSAKIMAEVVQPSNNAECPAPMQKGQCFVFSSCLPAGLCIHAAADLLPAVRAMQTNPSEKTDSPVTIQCKKSGCGAAFELRRI